jgi:hypothetical protein
MFNVEPTYFRETARAVAAALARHGTAHLVAGSLAVLEHGYPKVTLDVDFIVPDVLKAAEFATAGSDGRLARDTEFQHRIKQEPYGVIIDFLPAGKFLKTGYKVPFPVPEVVSDQLQFVSLEQLISLKLDSWINSPMLHLTDKTHVIGLIIRRKLPRDLAIHEAVRGLYVETWDAIKAEK